MVLWSFLNHFSTEACKCAYVNYTTLTNLTRSRNSSLEPHTRDVTRKRMIVMISRICKQNQRLKTKRCRHLGTQDRIIANDKDPHKFHIRY